MGVLAKAVFIEVWQRSRVGRGRVYWSVTEVAYEVWSSTTKTIAVRRCMLSKSIEWDFSTFNWIAESEKVRYDYFRAILPNTATVRKVHSVKTALLYVMDQLLQAMDSKKLSIMVFLDMSKAFDTISCYLSYKISTFPRVRWTGFRATFLSDNSAFELVMQFLKCSHSSSACRRVLF